VEVSAVTARRKTNHTAYLFFNIALVPQISNDLTRHRGIHGLLGKGYELARVFLVFSPQREKQSFANHVPVHSAMLSAGFRVEEWPVSARFSDARVTNVEVRALSCCQDRHALAVTFVTGGPRRAAWLDARCCFVTLALRKKSRQRLYLKLNPMLG
jgi:hypothetical protein